MKFKALLFSLFFGSFAAQATLITNDWKERGDGLATLDDSTGIEWLDLTVTNGYSINQVLSELKTDLKGWRFPSESEMSYLFSNYIKTNLAPGWGTSQTSNNSEISDVFRAKFGITQELENTSRPVVYSKGLHTLDSGDWAYTSTSRDYQRNPDYLTFRNQIKFDSPVDYNEKLTNAAFFLVSDGGLTLSSIENPELNAKNEKAPMYQVPIYGGSFFISFGLLALSGLRKKRGI